MRKPFLGTALIVLCGVVCPSLDGTEHIAVAYNPETHRQTVVDALSYIAENNDTKGLATDIKALFGDESRDPATLAHGARELDYKDDIWFRPTSLSGQLLAFIKGLGKCFSRYDDLYLTSLQHFLVIPKRPGTIWNTDGYAYRYTDMDKDDNDYLAFSSFFVSASDVKLDTEICVKALPPWFYRQIRNQANYQSNAGQEIQRLIFPPSTNLAEYFYEAFVNSSPINRHPSSEALTQLGYVLHLLQDVTVPHHVLGVLGGKHQEYETLVETLYLKKKSLRDDMTITSHLQNRKCLKDTCAIADLMLELAEHSRSQELAAGRYKDGRYYPGNLSLTESKARARELLNLSIAANIALLKKAARDWNSKLSQTGNRGRAEVYEASGEAHQVEKMSWRNFCCLNKVSADLISSRRSISVEILTFDTLKNVPASSLIDQDFLAELSQAHKDLLVSVVDGLLGALAEFHQDSLGELTLQEKVERAKQQLRDLFASLIVHTDQVEKFLKLKHRERTSPPRIVQFRLPRLEEVATEDKWKGYTAEKNRFDASIEYVFQTIASALARVELAHATGEMKIPTAAIEGLGGVERINQRLRNFEEAEQLFRRQFRR